MHLEKQYIQMRGGKSKNAKRVVGITERVAKMLEARSETITDPFAFTQYTNTYLSHLQQRVRDKLGWSADFCVHSLRHTCLTRLGEAGVDAFSPMRIAGHGSVQMTQRYTHSSSDTLKRAFKKLDELNGKSDEKRAPGGHPAPRLTTATKK